MEGNGTKPVPAVLTITATEDGNVNVTGPVDNPMLCFWLLKLADVTLTENMKVQNARVQPVYAGALRR